MNKKKRISFLSFSIVFSIVLIFVGALSESKSARTLGLSALLFYFNFLMYIPIAKKVLSGQNSRAKLMFFFVSKVFILLIIAYMVYKYSFDRLLYVVGGALIAKGLLLLSLKLSEK